MDSSAILELPTDIEGGQPRYHLKTVCGDIILAASMFNEALFNTVNMEYTLDDEQLDVAVNH